MTTAIVPRDLSARFSEVTRIVIAKAAEITCHMGMATALVDTGNVVPALRILAAVVESQNELVETFNRQVGPLAEELRTLQTNGAQEEVKT